MSVSLRRKTKQEIVSRRQEPNKKEHMDTSGKLNHRDETDCDAVCVTAL